jgi:16S rRNA (guanine966-N2)-methyltransferase
VKISAGWSKGLKIQTPEGDQLRPTRERVRQAAINMLQPWLTEARVLDLFAGSGAVGIELVSRGASGALFVEKAPEALTCLKANLNEAAARAKKQAVTLDPWGFEAKDVQKFLGVCGPELYDLVWADPPYGLAEYFLGSSAAEIPRILVSGGIFALECGVESLMSTSTWAQASGLELIKQREYGVTLITIWQKT